MDRVNGKGNDGHQDGHVIATTCTQLESFLSAVECFSTSSKCPFYVFHFIFTFPFCFCAQAHSNFYSFPSRAARQFAFVALKSTLFMFLKLFTSLTSYFCHVILRPRLSFRNFLSYCLTGCSLLDADTQIYKRLCPLVRWPVRPLVHHGDQAEKYENAHLWSYYCDNLCA